MPGSQVFEAKEPQASPRRPLKTEGVLSMNRIRKGCTLSFRWEVSKNGHPHSFWTVEDFIRVILSSSVATSQLLYFRRFFTKIQHAISSQIKLLGNCNLMHQNKGTEMVKTSVYMRKDDFEKVQQFSDDISWNLFMRRYPTGD